MEKKIDPKKIVFYSIGSLFVLGGILFALIPPFLTPDYHLYKNGEDVTQDYLLENFSERSDVSYVFEDGHFTRENELSYTISSSSLTESNNFTSSDNLMIKLGFEVSVDTFSSEEYQLQSNDTKVNVSLGDELYYTFDILRTGSNYYQTEEIYLDNSLSDVTLNITGEIILSSITDSNETTKLNIEIPQSSLYVLYFRG